MQMLIQLKVVNINASWSSGVGAIERPCVCCLVMSVCLAESPKAHTYAQTESLDLSHQNSFGPNNQRDREGRID